MKSKCLFLIFYLLFRVNNKKSSDSFKMAELNYDMCGHKKSADRHFLLQAYHSP